MLTGDRNLNVVKKGIPMDIKARLDTKSYKSLS